ncbi:response regulator [Candidatus Bathyarchaeota archaeon]|nr:response regulator [Candidatus Bathyarchaeota archaeon]
MAPRSVLIVDDDEDILDIFEMTLLEGGYTVETALTGTEALAKAKDLKFDVAILDIVLPDLRGDKLALKLKKANDDVNIIFVTGYANMQDCINSLNIGVSDILLKPIGEEELLQAVESALPVELVA